MRYVTKAVLLTLLLAGSAEAGWGHWRHFGYGFGGYGYHGVGLTLGYGVPPYYGVYSCYGPGDCWPGYGGYFGSHAGPIGLGYYGYPAYGIDYHPAAGHLSYRLPPFSEPAELNYGPQAVKQFLGLPRDFALGALREPVPPLPDRGVRLSNAEARERAHRHLADGDDLFRGQNYHAALQRYKLAVKAAPDLAEPYWRQGHALVATNNFELASGAFKRAIALAGDLARGGFKLDDLYGGAAMSKARHLESLAGWALDHEASADPYFLLGVFLTYDGDQQRAEKFFQRAADLAGIGGAHIAAFLNPAPNPPQLEAPAPAAPPAIAPRAFPIISGTEI